MLRSILRFTTALLATVFVAGTPGLAQAPAKARPNAPAAETRLVIFEGSIVELRGVALPGMGDSVTAFYVKRGTVTKRIVVRLTGTPAAPKTTVLKGLDELPASKVEGALNSPGRHVVVTHIEEPIEGADAYLATRVLFGFTELVGGTAFLAELGAIDKVVGTGAIAEYGSTVTVNYTGWLADGRMFDTSFGREAFEVRLGRGQIIKGWERGIPGMRVGGRRRLLVPSRLGYGVQGAAPDIPSNAVLVFDIELIGVR